MVRAQKYLIRAAVVGITTLLIATSVSVLATSASLQAAESIPAVAPVAAEAGTHDVVAMAVWPDPGYCCPAGWQDRPLAATVSISKPNYVKGDRVRITFTMASNPGKYESIYNPNPADPNQRKHRLSGTTRVQMGWSGQEILSYGGGGGPTMVKGTSVVFFPPPSYVDRIKFDNYIGNNLFGAGATMWIEYRAPDPAANSQGPGALLSALLWNDAGTAAVGGSSFTWSLPTSNRPPDAAFSYKTSGDITGKMTFTNTSSDPDGDALTYKWDFGDGTSSTAKSPSHTYSSLGNYDVTLVATDATGLTDTVSQRIEVKGLLDVTFFRVDGLGDLVKEGDSTEVRMRVTNNTGEDLTNVKLTGFSADPVAGSAGKATLSGPTSALGSTLGTGAASVGFADFVLTGVDPGDVDLQATVTAKNAAGEVVAGSGEKKFNVRATPLRISLVLDPAEFVLAEDTADPKPVKVTATLTFTNTTNAPLTDINLRSLDTERTVVGQPLKITQTGGVQPDPIDGLPLLASLGPGKTSKAFKATFSVTDDGDIKFSAIATAADDANKTVTGAVEKILKVAPVKYIELTVEVATPLPGKQLKAGSEIVLNGTVKNLSNTATLELGPLYPYVDGNTGLMSLAYEGPAANPEDFVAAGNLTLEVAETKTFQVRIKTNYSDPRNYGAQPSGGTRAQFRFEPWGVAMEADGTQTLLRTFEDEWALNKKPDAQVRAEAADLKVFASINDSITLPLLEIEYLSLGIAKGAIKGTLNAAIALVYSIPDLVKMPYTIIRATAAYQSKVWASFTEVEKDLFVDEWSFLIVSVLQRNVTMGSRDSGELYDEVNAYVGKTMTDMANEWETGDYVSVAEKYTSVGAEIIGSVMMPIALAKLAKTPKAVAALARAQKAIQARMAPLLATARELKYVENVLPVLKALENGAELNLDEIAKLYGISADEVAELQRLANKYKFLITVRSRHASSIKWIKKYGAMLKPEALKIKSVSELDVRLGYKLDDLGSLTFKKPEVLRTLDEVGGNLDDLVESFVQGKGFTKGTKDYDNAINRMEVRIKEWGKHELEYTRASERGWIETSFNYEGNAIPDTRTGLEKGKFTGFKLQKVGPDEYRVLLKNRKGKFVPVTGDIDPIAFTHTDGSPLTPKQHKQLLDEMRESGLLMAQHGESASFTEGGVDFVVGQFKPGEPGLQFAPNTNQSRVVRIDPSKSRWKNAEDYNLHWEGGFIDAGPSPDYVVRAPVDPNFNTIPLNVDAPKSIPLPIRSGPTPTVGRCKVNFDASASRAATYMAANGVLSTLSPNGTTAKSPAHDSCFGDGPEITIDIAPASSLAAAPSNLSATFVPQAATPTAAAAATTTLTLSQGDGEATVGASNGFLIGQQIAIGAGTSNVETRTITAIKAATLTLNTPLAKPHATGEVVLMIKAAPAPAPPPPPATPSQSGYWMLEADGDIYGFGDSTTYPAAALESGATAIAFDRTVDGQGLWILDSTGVVHVRGTATHQGNVTSLANGDRVSAISATPSGNGYWIFTDQGQVFAFGDATHYNDLPGLGITPVGAVVASAATPSGKGYYMLGADGGVFAFGDANFAGSIPQVLPAGALACPIVGLVPVPTGDGYWMVACDGGVFAFGDAYFVGSIPGVLAPGQQLNAPGNGMVPYANGYLM
ncbi:MAG: PKD domain-containing protein, partial [Acidimicrobiales bacterium]